MRLTLGSVLVAHLLVHASTVGAGPPSRLLVLNTSTEEMEHVTHMGVFDAPLAAALLPGTTALKVWTTEGGVSLGPYTVLLSGDYQEPVMLESDQAVARFLGGLKREVADVAAARETLMTFAELRHYTLQTAPPAEKRLIIGSASESSWGFSSLAADGGWRIECVFEDSDKWQRRYKVRVSETGVFEVQKTVDLVRGRYRR